MNWKDIQSALLAHGFDPKGIDGIPGRNTLAALKAFQRFAGLPLSGEADFATVAALGLSTAGLPPSKNSWPKQADVLAYKSIYGDPRGKGGATSSPEWEKANLVFIAPPFEMRMGSIPITRIRIHKACASSFERILRRIKAEANGKIETLRDWGVTEFGGTFNYRPMRGLTTLSMHSFGCAIDLDPARNGLGNYNGHFAKVPHVLRAFKEEGWTWGGDWNGNGNTADERRPDHMHFQATTM